MPPVGASFGHLQYEIKWQKAALNSRHPANIWKLHLSEQFPKLFDIALRLLMMGTQSADVERVCKANKVVHSKVRNRLTDKNVRMLLYCYVNLRLLKKHTSAKGDTTTQLDTMGDLEDFLDQAILVHTEENSNESN